jgi:hypothetical protein
VANVYVEKADGFSRTPAGETATIVTTSLMIGEGVISIIPLQTHLLFITEVNENRVYVVTTRGYQVAQFVAIVKAYANADFAEASRLVKELEPSRARY